MIRQHTYKHAVTFSLHCQLDWIQNHLRVIPLGVSGSVFLEKVNEREKTYTKCVWHHPMGWDLILEWEKERG